MSPLDTDRAIPVPSKADFAAWLAGNGTSEKELIVWIYKASSGKQTIRFDDLLEMALCYGWIDTQDKGIDAERYAIRFVPRKPGSNWSAYNRKLVRRLIDEGQMTPAGMALLPDDL